MATEQVTYSGWTSLEIGHMTPQYDQNFVLYTNPNQQSSGVNCKIRIFDLAQSDIRDFLAQGGMCRVVVRGLMRTAPHVEQGWTQTSTRYLHVTWIMRDQDPDFLGEDIIQSSPVNAKKVHVKEEEDEDDDTEYFESEDVDDEDDEEVEDVEEEEEEEDMDDFMVDDDEEESEDDDKTKQGSPVNDYNKRPAEAQAFGNNKKRKNGMSS